MLEEFNVIILPAGGWKDYQGNGAILDFVCWTFSSGCGQISLVLLSPCKTTIVVAMATFCVYLVKTAVAGDRVSLTATE